MVLARKPATRAEFDRFDVFYTDGTQRSNRRVVLNLVEAATADSAAVLARTRGFLFLIRSGGGCEQGDTNA